MRPNAPGRALPPADARRTAALLAIRVRRGRAHRALALLGAVAVLASLAAAAPAAAGADAGGLEETPGRSHTPYDRQGMWIWYVSHSEGGSIPAIVARAKANEIGTVYVKSGDGATVWNQYNQSLIGPLHRAGLDVCAWQFVYGDAPVAEARVGAVAVHRGADCLVIDAEADYEGKYAAADLYIRTLRALIGADFPLSLAGFPYVDYHPAFPYSVFLGPGGATFNQPQMYWKAIGTSVQGVYEHTYRYNRIWGHPIYPIGQTYEGPSSEALRLFRRYAASFGNYAPSWWDWQETSPAEWSSLGAASADRPLSAYRVNVVHPLLKIKSKGDMVVWAQERLVSAGAELPVTGLFGAETQAAVRTFQEAHGLPSTGVIGTETWQALLAYEPEPIQWSAARPGPGALGARATPARKPLSASLPAKADEIPPGPRAPGP
ncbi:MAG TPA: peptidoglycan-binding domain-containing protein [Solirubrobacterales bacterium]